MTLLGSDQAERHFLVKGGEDLRLDQRVQLLFGAMGRVLSSHAPSASRGLGLATYAVLPLSAQTGLIEWVDGTTTLKTVISDQATLNTKRRNEAAGRLRASGEAEELELARKAFSNLHPDGAAYLKRVASTNRRQATADFDKVSALVSPDLLARGVAGFAVSAEAYLRMRTHFSRSLAALTACGHVLGIGDRHLDNFLMQTATGAVIGIDFGHAFGSATYMLPVPELVGVRLTTQLTSFLRPLHTDVLLKTHLRTTFGALRGRREELLRTLEVFLSEPIIEWADQTRRLTAEQARSVEAEAEAAPTINYSGSISDAASLAASSRSATQPGEAETASLVDAWAQRRLDAVARKLRGANSSAITISELE